MLELAALELDADVPEERRTEDCEEVPAYPACLRAEAELVERDAAALPVPRRTVAEALPSERTVRVADDLVPVRVLLLTELAIVRPSAPALVVLRESRELTAEGVGASPGRPVPQGLLL